MVLLATGSSGVVDMKLVNFKALLNPQLKTCLIELSAGFLHGRRICKSPTWSEIIGTQAGKYEK